MAAVGRNEPLCDLKNVVAFGHNELWRPKAANDLFVTLIWPQKWPIWQPWEQRWGTGKAPAQNVTHLRYLQNLVKLYNMFSFWLHL